MNSEGCHFDAQKGVSPALIEESIVTVGMGTRSWLRKCVRKGGTVKDGGISDDKSSGTDHIFDHVSDWAMVYWTIRIKWGNKCLKHTCYLKVNLIEFSIFDVESS
jgi:hypothetical protein